MTPKPGLLGAGQEARDHRKGCEIFFKNLKNASWELLLFFLMFIYFEEDVCRGTRRGGAERERTRIPSRFRAVGTEPDVGLELTNCEIMRS